MTEAPTGSSSRGFQIRLRFVLWTLAVVASIVGTFIWIWLLRAERPAHGIRILIDGGALLEMPLLGVLILLSTTPADAIRLPSRFSRGIILCVAVDFQIAALIFLRSAQTHGEMRVASAALAVFASALLVYLLDSKGRSTWWAVLFAWNPLAVIEGGGRGNVGLIVAVLMILLGVWLLRWALKSQERNLKRRVRATFDHDLDI